MKKRWTIRELTMLLLPVLALGGYGLWLQNSKPVASTSASSSGRLALTLQSVEVAPATPRLVYEGFDTLVKVKYDWPQMPKLPNALPSAKSNDCLEPWLTYKVQNKTHRVATKKDALKRMVFAGSNRVEFRINLSKVPLKYGELTLHSAVIGIARYNVTLAGGKVVVRELPVAQLPVSIVVRKAGENVKTPIVAKLPGFKVKAIARDAFVSTSGQETIKVIFENLQPTNVDRWYFATPRLVDARGKEYIYAIRPGATGFSWVQESAPANEPVDRRFPFRWFSFRLDQMPKSAGKITFKTEVSLNDGWPLPISFVVRR